MHVYEMMNTIFIESINDIYATIANIENKNKHFNNKHFQMVKETIIKNLERCRKVKEYGNNELKKISLDFNNVVPILKDDYFIENGYPYPYEYAKPKQKLIVKNKPKKAEVKKKFKL